jgi:hypothetical protein
VIFKLILSHKILAHPQKDLGKGSEGVSQGKGLGFREIRGIVRGSALSLPWQQEVRLLFLSELDSGQAWTDGGQSGEGA